MIYCDIHGSYWTDPYCGDCEMEWYEAETCDVHGVNYIVDEGCLDCEDAALEDE